MSWQTIVFIRQFTHHVLRCIVLKKTADTSSAGMGMEEKNYWQFFLCFLCSLGYLFLTPVYFHPSMVGIALLGILNAWAAYYYWLAIQKSLVQSSIMAVGDDIIALSLGYMFLGELALLTKTLVILVVLALVACIIFIMQQPGKKITDRKFIKWIVVFSTIWGVCYFVMRYYGLRNDVSIAQFMTAWYGGSWIGAFLLTKFQKVKVRRQHCRAAGKELTALVSTAWISVFLALLAFSFPNGALTYIQPINLVGEMMLPCVVGLYIMKYLFPHDKKLNEQEHLSFSQKCILFLGFGAAIAIAIFA